MSLSAGQDKYNLDGLWQDILSSVDANETSQGQPIFIADTQDVTDEGVCQSLDDLLDFSTQTPATNLSGCPRYVLV